MARNKKERIILNNIEIETVAEHTGVVFVALFIKD